MNMELYLKFATSRNEVIYLLASMLPIHEPPIALKIINMDLGCMANNTCLAPLYLRGHVDVWLVHQIAVAPVHLCLPIPK